MPGPPGFGPGLGGGGGDSSTGKAADCLLGGGSLGSNKLSVFY